MKLLNLKVLDKFLRKHQTARRELEIWKALIERAQWVSSGAIQADFPKVRWISQNRLVFRLGHRWRIDVQIIFDIQAIFIKRIGTHEEYNKWDFNN
jgi:mRNA interferase HigB